MNPTTENCTPSRTEAIVPRTRTVNVEPQNARAGDMFTGTILYGGVTYIVTGPLFAEANVRRGDTPRLYVTGKLPYIDVRDWRDVSITREVPVLTQVQWLLDLPIGTWLKTRDNYVFVKIEPGILHRMTVDRGVSIGVQGFAINAHQFGALDYNPDRYVIFEPEINHQKGWGY